jgi:hypothetical protein
MKVKRFSLELPKSPAIGRARKALITAVCLLSSFYLTGCITASSSERQTMVHQMGSQVMPFDLGKTQHVFQMTDNGGIQLVVVKDLKDTDQISLIRQHLQHEAMRFQSGDFSDPTSLHGTSMPGISELSKGAANIRIEYSELPDGAQIAFMTDDIHLITAIHRWFGAQLSDHGSDATSR